jgi:hypothetical protein
MREGAYVVKALARQRLTGEWAETEAAFDVTSRIGTPPQPAVFSTEHPLVFLYSAPPCDAPAMTVEFVKAAGAESPTSTSVQACDGRTSMNFWIAGLEPDTDYQLRHRLWNEKAEAVAAGPWLQFHTGRVTASLPAVKVLQQSAGQMDLRYGLLLQALLASFEGGPGVANKLDGTPVWYYDVATRGNLQYLMRPLEGGTMLVVPGGEAAGGLREIDLAGNTLWETNPQAISDRLSAMDRPSILGFHHDALRLPNGLILALANSQRILPPTGPGTVARTVIGDMILLLNRDCDILWVWDAFEKLDVNRKALLGEMNGRSEDWTHSNALQYLPDGNLLLSIRHMDWIVKIDFQDGRGSGDVLWRLGKDGDFTLESSDPYPWFSHQHSQYLDGARLWVYDNGNTRAKTFPDANSRGQVYRIDESARTARLELNADLGVYSPALGSAQRLGNGNYHFLSGNLLSGPSGAMTSQSAEVSSETMEGTIRYVFQANAGAYRSFRMISLYTVQ